LPRVVELENHMPSVRENPHIVLDPPNAYRRFVYMNERRLHQAFLHRPFAIAVVVGELTDEVRDGVCVNGFPKLLVSRFGNAFVRQSECDALADHPRLKPPPVHLALVIPGKIRGMIVTPTLRAVPLRATVPDYPFAHAAPCQDKIQQYPSRHPGRRSQRRVRALGATGPLRDHDGVRYPALPFAQPPHSLLSGRSGVRLEADAPPLVVGCAGKLQYCFQLPVGLLARFATAALGLVRVIHLAHFVGEDIDLRKHVCQNLCRMAVFPVVGLQGFTGLVVTADFPQVPPDKALQPRGQGGRPPGSEETPDVLQAVGPDGEIDFAMHVGAQVNQSLRKRLKLAIVRPMPLSQRHYCLSLVSTVVEDGSAWALADLLQERLPYGRFIRRSVGPEGMMLQRSCTQDGQPDQVVTLIFGDPLNIQEQFNGGPRDPGQFMHVYLAGSDRQGLQLHLERSPWRAIPLFPPRPVQVRKLRDGENAFLVEAPEQLRRHPGE